MNLNKRLTNEGVKKIPTKRVIQAGVVSLAMTAMVGTAAFNSNASDDKATKTGTSGIIASLSGEDEAALQIAGSGVTSVGMDSESAQWVLSLMANVDDYANVHVSPSEGSEIAGKLRRGDMARVESLTNDGWYQITSGNLSGYIKSDICLTGQACKEFASAVGYDGSVGITAQEEAEQLAEFKAAVEEAAKKMEAAQTAAKSSSSSSSSSYSQASSYAATADEVTLLAAIVEKEDGSDGYEGQLAVASAIMNRVRSSNYPNTIYAVIDQKGQFVGGIAGLSKILARGPSATSRRAAEAAIAGADTVNGMTNFRADYTGHYGTLIGEHVFF
ncbi:MAG: cell wall hydrolase [Lachnospiraceae bacterium]|nr:cell wall hydrolase [Lachnospiraceae bacterium]